MSVGLTTVDHGLLHKLNTGSWARSFSPQADVDWADATTDTEYLALYHAWSLLLGSRYDAAMNDAQRVAFAKYQQMNLMWFTALFERHGLVRFESLYDDDGDLAYQEYVSHLIKEETYHYLLFQRGVAAIRATDPTLKPLPQRHMNAFLRVTFFLFGVLPRRLRHGMFFFLLRFVEEITLQAHRMAQETVARRTSLVPRIWAVHALDEARHVAFDDLMLRRAELPGVLAGLPRLLTLPLCAVASLMLNGNEVWAARAVGVPISYAALPGLYARTTAPFKRRVFALLRKRLPQAPAPENAP